jgi:hypothetical protein
MDDNFLTGLRMAMFKIAAKTVPMGLLRVTVENFPLSVLQGIIATTVQPFSASSELPDWDRQEASTLLWQQKSTGKETLHGYILQTWDAISSLCSFERLLEPGSTNNYAFGGWRSAGRSGDLIVVLPPLTIRHR